MKFRQFLENAERMEPKTMKARIPLDDEVFMLRTLLQRAGFNLQVVGGAVRDYLFHALQRRSGAYKPKDVDLVTDANPDQIKVALSVPEAEELGLHVLPIGAQFGVVMIQFPFRTETGDTQYKRYEIATYRKDVGGDGRRPDAVEFTSAQEDAARRDLTMNALYYDIPDDPADHGMIIDYNQGQGFKDIENGVARPIGDPEQRFTEDNLRVMRLIRFFCRYNNGDGNDIEKNDPATAAALRKFAKMPQVSSERIAAEFLSGLRSSINPINYLKTLHHFGIMERMFPTLKINTAFTKLGALKQDQSMLRNPRIVLGFLLKDNDPTQVQQVLTQMAYPVQKGEGSEYKLVPNVTFLIRLLSFKPEHAYDMSREVERIRPQAGKPTSVTEKDVAAYAEGHQKEMIAWAILFGLDINQITNFARFRRSVNANDVRLKGMQGPQLGQGIKDLEMQNFLNMTNGKK